jgi:probable rRNA maturation factor
MPLLLQILPPRFAPLARPVRRLLRLLHLTSGSWSISLVRDPEMAALHKRTMNDPTTTDVLTFDLRGSPTPQTSRLKSQDSIDLDTVICLDEARRRAQELRHPVEHELLLYALHSLLHVQGYDDRTRAQSKRMHAREDQLLTAVGIGPVYGRLMTQDSRRKTTPPHRKSIIKNRKVGRAP